MIDPVTALGIASAAFTGVKKAVKVGQEIEQVYKQLSKWATAIEDCKEHINQQEARPPIFAKLSYKKSATEEAFDTIALKKKVKEQEDAIRELFTANWQNPNMGLDGYRKFISVRREIRAKREKSVYNQIRRRKAFLYNTKLGIAIGVLSLSLIYMIYFLWNAIVEASK